MRQYIDTLRQLCAEDHRPTSPYLLRTRFERNLFGLLVTFSESAFGTKPSGMTERQIQEFISRNQISSDHAGMRVLIFFPRIFEKFTYLCDTSNISNDGQDPRVKACSSDILELCELIESNPGISD